MAFDVRIFGYRGVTMIPKILPRQDSSDSVGMLVEPYEFAERKTTNGATPVSFTPVPLGQTKIVRIEVPDAQTIRYEIRPPGDVTVVSTNSPRLSGIDHFPIDPGWTVSVIEGP